MQIEWREWRDSGATNCPQTHASPRKWREWRILPTYRVASWRGGGQKGIEKRIGEVNRRIAPLAPLAPLAPPDLNATPASAQGGTLDGDPHV